MVISIETEFLEMNLDIDRIFGLFFSLKYDPLSSVPYRYINELPISSVKLVHLAYDN